MVWIWVSKSLIWDKLKLSAKTDCIRTSNYYDVRSELIWLGNALRWRVEPDCADTLKNGELALKLRRSYTYASKYALILQILKKWV